MTLSETLALVAKGLRALPILIGAGQDVIPLVKRLAEVAGGAKVSAEELAQLEADLDAALDEFNAPLD